MLTGRSTIKILFHMLYVCASRLHQTFKLVIKPVSSLSKHRSNVDIFELSRLRTVAGEIVCS